MTSRTETHEKAWRYLVGGRLTVLQVHDDLIRARCRGGETYSLVFVEGGWWCSCPAHRVCSHLLALQLVVNPPRTPA